MIRYARCVDMGKLVKQWMTMLVATVVAGILLVLVAGFSILLVALIFGIHVRR